MQVIVCLFFCFAENEYTSSTFDSGMLVKSMLCVSQLCRDCVLCIYPTSGHFSAVCPFFRHPTDNAVCLVIRQDEAVTAGTQKPMKTTEANECY